MKSQQEESDAYKSLVVRRPIETSQKTQPLSVNLHLSVVKLLSKRSTDSGAYVALIVSFIVSPDMISISL